MDANATGAAPAAPSTEAAPAAPIATPTPQAAPPAPAELSPFDAAVKALTSPENLQADGTPAPPAPATPPADAKPSEPAGEPKAEAKKPDPFAQRFEALAKQQAALRKEREEFKKQMEDPAVAALRKARESKDPITALQALGFSYEQATEQVLSGKVAAPPKPDPEMVAKVAAMEGELKALREERQQAQAAAELQNFKGQVAKKAQEAGPKYELVTALDAVEEVVDAIGQYVQEYGAFPGGSPEAAIEQGLSHVQQIRQEQAEREWAALLRTEWGKSKLASAAPKPAAPGPQASSSAKSIPRTLTNVQAQAATKPAPEPTTPEEYRRRAAEILFGGS